MATKNVDIDVSVNSKGNGSKQVVSGLQAIEQQANRTREKMQKIADVGNKMALVGGAMLAPFALAMKKYVDTAKETEPISKRLVALNKKWEESQVRLGRVTAELVLPALEKALNFVDKIVAFAEKNPGIVKAALTIGTTLVILGGIISTTAQLVATVATLQGLAAAAGWGSVGSAATNTVYGSRLAMAAAGASGTGAAGAGAAGMSAAVAAGFTAAIPFLLTGLAVWAASELTLAITNSILGTNQTWGDLLETTRILVRIVEDGFNNFSQNIIDAMRSIIGNTATNVILAITRSISSLFIPLGWVSQAIDGLKSLFSGGHASGGYSGGYRGFGLYGEKGHEFTMNAASTRNAERAIGGRLTQSNSVSYMTNNVNLANGQTVVSGRRAMRQQQKNIAGALLGVMGA